MLSVRTQALGNMSSFLWSGRGCALLGSIMLGRNSFPVLSHFKASITTPDDEKFMNTPFKMFLMLL